jgi:four helix bundle protein
MSYKSLLAYQKAFLAAMKIFEITKRFPKEEMFGLTGQIRRSSRSVFSTLLKGTEKEDMKHTVSVNFRMLIWKILKRRLG